MAVLVVLVSGAATAWLLLVGPLSGSAPAAAAGQTGGTAESPRLVSIEDLQQAAADDGPFYWAGARPDQRYEMTRTPDGAVFVRYLPVGVPAGADDPYLTVATYPGRGGAASLQTASTGEGLRSWRTTSGALVVVDSRAPRSTYFSFDDVDFQVEVYAPVPGAAEELVLGGGVSQVEPPRGEPAGGAAG